MGRAYEVRKASIQKTGAARGKIYTMYAKEIYQAAKTGGTDPSSNATLKRLLDRAKKEQVPSDIIKRAIDKVNSGVDENFEQTTYEMFGPSGSTFIVECLTDNLNRTVSDLRAVVNKCHIKMGAMGSVLFNYDHLCVVGFKGLSLDEVMDALILNNVDAIDIEEDEGMIIVYGNPTDLYQIKEAVLSLKEVDFEIDEITYIPKEKITLPSEDKELFERIITMLDDTQDVQHIYHNVEL